MSEARGHVITYPGFAESKEARGLYPEIKSAFPEHTFHILPFYEERPDGERVIHSTRKHAEMVEEYMDDLEGEITMLAKCGGSRVAVAIDDQHMSRVDKLCLLNPPWKVSNEFLLHQLGKWHGTEHPDGSWSIPRGASGSNYIVSNEYVHDVDISDLMGRYREIARDSTTKLFIVRALSDEILPPIHTEKIPGAIPIDIEGGDHHLTDDARTKTLAALALHGVL